MGRTEDKEGTFEDQRGQKTAFDERHHTTQTFLHASSDVSPYGQHEHPRTILSIVSQINHSHQRLRLPVFYTFLPK